MTSTVRPKYTRFPPGATVRCTRCDKVGTTYRISAHTARGRCQGAEIELLTVPPGTDHIVQALTQAVRAEPVPVSAPPVPPPDPGEAAARAAGLTPVEPVAAAMDPALDDDGEEDDQEPEGEGLVEDETAAYEVPIAASTGLPDRRIRPRPGTAGDRVTAPPTFVEEAWKPGHLAPETHVYYRLARTDPRFAELFGSNYRGPSVYAFADEIVHAFFMVNLRYGLGLAALEETEAGVDEVGEAEVITIPVDRLRDVVLELMQGASNGRTASHAGAA